MQRTKWMLASAMLAGALVTAILMKAPAQTAMAQEKDPHGAAKPGDPISTKDISADQAHSVLMAAMNKAKEMNLKQDIAVVDAGGNLKAFMRMDGAWIGSIDIAIKKAKTSRFFDMPSGDIGKLSQPGQPLYMIEVSNGGLITFPGGVPIKQGDQIIGAIGSSGSTVENDHAVAQAGAGVIK
ncbi:MAG TPA: heme-binding protein [Tepidisphaeraceae bacterium]|jgi:uncharacterized protein GlcG (DUF336 family)